MGLGGLVGAFPPAACFWQKHVELDPSKPLAAQAATWVIGACLAFSATTVFAWARQVFIYRSKLATAVKAAAFVMLLELVMVTSSLPLSCVALVLLVGINVLVSGYNIACGGQDDSGTEGSSSPDSS